MNGPFGIAFKFGSRSIHGTITCQETGLGEDITPSTTIFLRKSPYRNTEALDSSRANLGVSCKYWCITY